MRALRLVLAASIASVVAAQPASAAVFGTPFSSYAIGVNPSWLASGDFNNDGKPDLAATNQNIGGTGSITVLLGVGNGTFTSTTITVPNRPQAAVVGDFNNDGNLDLATPRLNASDDYILLGNGSGGFTPGGSVSVPSNPVSIAVGDYNGDGNLDLATASQTGTPQKLSVSLGNGTGAFTTSPTTYNLASDAVNTAVAGDFNGDGKQDVAVANGHAHYLDVLLGNGDGAFTAAPTRTTGGATNYSPFGVGVGDFNADGKQDLAAANTGDNTIGTVLGVGDGTFGSPSITPGATNPASITVADFNGDGKQDLASAGGTKLFVATGNGNGTFSIDSNPTFGSNLNVVATGDFNGDGRPDLAVNSSDDQKVYIVLNQSTAAVPGASSVRIQELRLAGPTGARDQYVELYNPGTTPVQIGGWKLIGSNGERTVLPDGALIAAKGHYLISGPTASALTSRYSLLSPTPEDAFLAPGPVEGVGGGVKLVNLAGTAIDAVGFSAAGAGFFEGTPITTPTNTGTAQLSLVRKFSAGEPVDNNDNASDFKLVATDSDTMSHNGTEVLGAPSPFDLRSPTNINNGAQSSLYNSGSAATAAPNMVYTPPASGDVSSANPGTLVLRRTITNCLGQPLTGVCANAQSGTTAQTITRLKLQLTGISTYGDPFGATGTSALLRPVSSDASAGFAAMALDSPSPSSGGGLNSTLTIPVNGGLAAGSSLSIELKLRADRRGTFGVAYNLLDDLEGPALETTPDPVSTDELSPSATAVNTATTSPLGAPDPSPVTGAAAPVNSVTGVITATTVKPVAHQHKTKHRKHKKKHKRKHTKKHHRVT